MPGTRSLNGSINRAYREDGIQERSKDYRLHKAMAIKAISAIG
jgi:hypothetical protein